MKILLVSFILFITTNVVFSQNETIVSLLDRLQSSRTDIDRVDYMNRLTFKYLDINQLDKGLEMGNTALELATDIEYLQGEARALESIGLYNKYNNEFQNSICFFEASLKIHEHTKDSVQIAILLESIGSVYKILASYHSALTYYYRAEKIISKTHDTTALASNFNMLGLVYFAMGDYEKSLQYFLRSINLYLLIGDDLGISQAYCNIGMLYGELQEIEQGQEYLERALKLNKKFGPTRDILEIYTQIGKLKRASGKKKEAIKILDKNLKLAKYYNDSPKVAECFNDIGESYHDLGDYKSAINYYRKALSIRNELGITRGSIISATNIARVYLSMIEARRSGQFNDFPDLEINEIEIQQLLDKAIQMARESVYYSDLILTYETMILAHSTFNRFSEANYYQTKLIRLKDSIACLNQRQSIAKLQADFDRDQTEQEIVLLNSEKIVQESLMRRQEIQRYVYIGGGIGLILLIIGLFNRLSFTKRIHEELQLKNVQIEEEKKRAEQNENVQEQFLSKMSHEIRIPMNTIIGSVNIILNGEYLKTQKKYLNAICQSSENLLVIIDDILDLTKLKAGKIKLEKTPFNFKEEIENVEHILKYKAKEKGIRFKTNIAADVPEQLIGDSTRLSQILINLAGNGIKFTDKGDVNLRARVKEKSENKILLQVSVEDSGIGIPEDRLEKIFNSFTQAENNTTRKYGGTGLGLTISKQLLELQNGKITVTSEPGVGSKFIFEIPYEPGSNDIIEKDSPVTTGYEILKNLRVLVVEDDVFNNMILKDTLSSTLADVKIEVAENGKDALDKWRKSKFDIILMDIELPFLDGHQVTQAIRNSTSPLSDIPIIAMTANAMPKEVEACFISGMNDYIAKPFDPDDLIIKISSVLIDQKPEDK